MNDRFILVMGIFWLLMLVGVALAAYSFGWWWRGRHEEPLRREQERRLRRTWEWEQPTRGPGRARG